MMFSFRLRVDVCCGNEKALHGTKAQCRFPSVPALNWDWPRSVLSLQNANWRFILTPSLFAYEQFAAFECGWWISFNIQTGRCIMKPAAHILMKQLFSSPDSAEIGLLRSRLEAAGIECETRNEYSTISMYGAAFYPEIWVLKDEKFAEASQLLAAWRRPSPPSDTH
jgi:hypothetical protein